MEISSSSSNHPFASPKNYQVFLSFRGKDARHNFISHLYEALCRKGIKTYIDNEELKRGEVISCGLMKAIEESKISVIIFSKNYASSTWCLDELSHILSCKEQNRHEVIPVFYHIDPSWVRKQQGSFAKAFDVLEKRFRDKMEKVHKWRKALNQAANLSGFSTQDIRLDSELLKEIIQDISRKLKRMSTNDDTENFVGIDRRINEIKSLLRIGSPDVRVIGLWGMGGIGKTTLASILYDRFSSKFESSCFLRNIKEEWKNGRKKYHLQSNLFSKLLEEDRNMNIPYEGSTFKFYKERLQGKKVLIVLDDVNDEEQLEYLLGIRSQSRSDWFGPKSRIILTSQDRSLFENRVDRIYQVRPLDFNEALQLFHLNVFDRNSAITNCTELSKVVVEYATGNPLALKVIGSLFRSKSKEKWESLIVELKRSPNNAKIHNVLRRSYDELDDKHKDIFLDIACFFKGWNRCDVEEMLRGYDFSVDVRIDDLVYKSLITINYKNEVNMHDLIQEMGREIVRQQSIKEPGKRSRLWMAQDVYRVFKNNTASKMIEGIFLDASLIKEVRLCQTVFQKTFELRLLKIYSSEYLCFDTNNTTCKVHLPQGLESLPDSLRYLHWDEYPLKSLPLNFAPENLVQLIMHNSKVEKLWDGVQSLSNLKIIDVSCSKKLIQMPDLSLAPNLVKMKFRSCTSLFQVPPPGFQNFDKLTHLDMSHCGNLLGLPNNFFSRSLIHLDLRGCRKIRSIPKMKKSVVVYLDLSETSIGKFPASFVSFNQLAILKLEDCQGLKNLTSIDICQLKSLRTLNLSGCSSLETISELPRSLRELNLSRTSIEQVPSSIETLSQLKFFMLRGCNKLQSLPASICKLKSLWELDLDGCSKFESFPKISEPIDLSKLILSKTAIKELPSTENLLLLSELRLRFCENLKFVPSNIYNLKKLQILDISSYSELLKRLPPTTRHTIDLSVILCLLDCDMLEIPDHFVGGLSWVRDLHITGTNLDTIPSLSIQKFTKLRVLSIRNWKNLRYLPELPLTLSVLDATGCASLETVPRASPRKVPQIAGKYRSHVRIFLNCLKLDQSSRNNTTYDAQLRFLSIANHTWSRPSTFYVTDEAWVCYPGNDIPAEWYKFQSIGSSIKLSPSSEYWRKSQFMGLSFCIVAAFEEHNYSYLGLQFRVEVHTKIDSGKSFKHEVSVGIYDETEDGKKTRPTIINSDHVLMSYNPISIFAFSEAREEGVIAEISFHFQPIPKREEDPHVHSWKVKRCGVRVLHRQEAEELGFSVPKFDEDEELENAYNVRDSKVEAKEECSRAKPLEIDSDIEEDRKVRRRGARKLYLQEAEEHGFSIPKYDEDVEFATEEYHKAKPLEIDSDAEEERKVQRRGARVLYHREADELGFSIPKYDEDVESENAYDVRDSKVEAIEEYHRAKPLEIDSDGEEEEENDLANAQDAGDSGVEAVEEYHQSEIVEIGSSSVEEKVDEAEDFPNAHDVGDSKVEEPHEKEIKLGSSTIEEGEKNDENDKLKSTSSCGCLEFLSHNFRAIYDHLLGKNSGIEPHLDSSAKTSRAITSTPWMEIQERLRAQDEEIQNLRLQMQMVMTRPPI